MLTGDKIATCRHKVLMDRYLEASVLLTQVLRSAQRGRIARHDAFPSLQEPWDCRFGIGNFMYPLRFVY